MYRAAGYANECNASSYLSKKSLRFETESEDDGIEAFDDANGVSVGVDDGGEDSCFPVHRPRRSRRSDFGNPLLEIDH